MENNEIEILHRLNKNMSILIANFNELVNDISKLTEIIYNKEIDNLNKEKDIRLHSHM